MSVPDNELIAEVNHGSTHCGVVLAHDAQWKTHSIWHQCEFDLRGKQSSIRLATISHLSVIFLSEEDVDVKPMIASWIAQQLPEC